MSTFRLVSEGAHPDSEWLSPYDPPFCCGWNWHQERPFRKLTGPWIGTPRIVVLLGGIA